MGNHEAGRAMGRGAEMALQMRTNQTALELLDMICEPYRGADAEFEAVDPDNPRQIHPLFTYYTDPSGPLGILMREAFAPSVAWMALQQKAIAGNNVDDFFDKWEDGPMKQFDARYDFC